MTTVTALRRERGESPTGVATRLVRYFKAQAEDWYDECRQLAAWEDQYLVGDVRKEKLAEHARMLDELERVGRWLGQVTQAQDFPDRATADLVTMTLQDLKDCRAMWHRSQLSEKQKAKILKACFNES